MEFIWWNDVFEAYLVSYNPRKYIYDYSIHKNFPLEINLLYDMIIVLLTGYSQHWRMS